SALLIGVRASSVPLIKSAGTSECATGLSTITLVGDRKKTIRRLPENPYRRTVGRRSGMGRIGLRSFRRHVIGPSPQKLPAVPARVMSQSAQSGLTLDPCLKVKQRNLAFGW